MQEKEKFEEQLEKVDPLEEEEIEKQKIEILKKANTVTKQQAEEIEEERKKDKLLKVLEGIDNSSAKSSLMDKLKDADDSVLARLKAD